MNLSDFDVLCCHDARCANNGHKTQVDALYSELPTCLVSAVSSTIIFYLLFYCAQCADLYCADLFCKHIFCELVGYI